MNKEELEQIAQRPSCCKPFGASVTLSVGERDELVAMARRYVFLKRNLPNLLAVAAQGGVNTDEAPSIFEKFSDMTKLDSALDAAMTKEEA
ncbi:hypothetical protein [Achromobacter xylosoxidans]|uniref:Uncharacterized protein n=1 Tax=Alcaligenes xylosoxydans xylosoxydans TaxID=85698 RepID=A0A424W5E4_ALCXX|nr:hypothetical protein [Achromobacter xylosoxidans]MBC9904805.1 hypothetical protein [Achromobacter xylosoxidans]MBD0868722.1 hypothetical protein [Achromobacter xylosoxidans]QNP87776.1 hypothetical protein IAG39_09815 [Achromobacter xylosoxidans]RPJ88447.1 hypothetical protein DY367_27970 [Achromobacter xylosoxidans]